MNTSSAAAMIISHLGGKDLLDQFGAHSFVIDDTHVSVTLNHDNSKGVHIVSISMEPNGKFIMTSHGRMKPGHLTPPVLERAIVDIPDNLATVFGSLTGIEFLRHHHY